MSDFPRRSIWLAGAALALVFAATLALGADPAPLHYRRVYVPEADLDQQIRGLLPLKRDEFDRRIQEAELRGRALTTITQARVEQAVYRAKLQGDALAGGKAELTIKSISKQSSVLPLGTCSLAVGTAAWRGNSLAPAQLGNLPDGRLACIVSRSGQLEFDWSLIGRREESGDLTFEMDLPPVPLAWLELELPAAAELVAEGGVVSRNTTTRVDKGLASWLVEVGGSSRVVLRVGSRGENDRLEPMVLVRESNDYQIQAAAVDLETTLELNILHQPIRQLVLAFDEPLVLTQVRMGGKLLDWAPLSTPGSKRLVIVHLPELLIGDQIVLQASGVANLIPAAKQRLPRIRVEAGVWQSGESTVNAPPDLTLNPAPESSTWQTAFSEATPARPQVQWRFQHYQADGAIDLTLLRTTPLLVERSGLVLDVQPTQVQATLTAEIAAASSPKFDLEARIPRAWIVDSIDVQPADWLEDRTLQTQGTGPQTLRLRLRQPLVPGRPLTLVVRAHRRRPTDEQLLESDAWTLWRLADVSDARRLVELRSSDPTVQIGLTDDPSLQRVDPQSLTAADRKLFDALPSGIVWEADQRAEGVRVRLLPTVPRFEAQIALRADFDRQGTSQLCRLRIQPDDSVLAVLRVRFSPPPPDPIVWSMGGEEAKELVVERIVPPVPTAGEAFYELRLQRPRRTPFEVLASFTRPPTSSQHVPLVSVPGATSQSGLVEVHSSGGLPLVIESGDLRGTPPLDRRATELATVRGTYQYQPDRAASLKVQTLSPDRAPPMAWIDSLRGISSVTIDGSGDHEFDLSVRNYGQRELVVRLDPGAANLRVDVQGRRLLGSLARRKTNEYVIPLPPAQRELVVRLSYTSPAVETTLLPFARFQVPWPQPNVSVLDSRWYVRLAPGVALRGATPAAVRDSASTANANRESAEMDTAWSEYEVAAPSAPLASLAVYRPGIIAAWSWGITLIAAAVVWRMASSSAEWLIAVAGGLAALTFLLPAELVPFATGSLAGLALGGVGTLIRPRLAGRILDDRSLGSRRAGNLALARSSLIVLVLLIGAVKIVRAAPPIAGSDATDQRWWRVVIAVDDDQQPVGEYVFLEPEFYDALLRMTDRDTAESEWLLAAATYRPSFVVVDGVRAIDIVQIALEIETFHSEARLEFPFNRREVRLVEGRSQLDGKPAITEWSASGRLVVTASMPGKHRIELALIPTVAGRAEGLVGGISIPQANASRVMMPSGSDAPSVAGSHGISMVADGTADQAVFIGPLDRLALQVHAVTRDNKAASVEGEQVVLWNVRPGSVLAEGRFRIRPIGGVTREVAIEYDPRLRPLPLPADVPVARQWTTQSPGANVLHLSLAEPAAVETSLGVSFAWTGARGIGDIDLPPIRLRCDRQIRDWIAVSLGGGLGWKAPESPRTDDPPQADLIAAWGQPLPAGTLVFNRLDRPLPPLISVPQESNPIVAQELTCSFSLQAAAVRYVAKLTNIPTHGFQHRFDVTGGLRIIRLSARDGERLIRSRWTQAADGTVFVELAEPPPSSLQIDVEGGLALPRAGGSHQVPIIQCRTAAESDLTVSILRLPSAQLTISASPQSWESRVDPQLGRQPGGQGRLVGVFHRKEASTVAPLQVMISSNTPNVMGLSLARLTPIDSAWELDLRCTLEVTGGQLDAIRWELPAGTTGPLRIVPPAEHELSLAGPALSRLLVRPEIAATDKLQVQVRVPLGTAADAGSAVPLPGLLDSPKVRRLVALPRRGGERRFDWTTSGLQAIDPSHLPLPAEWVPPGYDLFEAVAPRPSAAAQVRATSVPKAQVLLADHHLRLHSVGLLTGTTTVDLLPGGTRQVTVVVPPGMRLMHASVEGTLAQLSDRGAGQWILATAGARAPQRIELVYSGSAAPEQGVGEVNLAVPYLVGANAKRTLWTVAGAASGETATGRDQEGGSQAVARLAALATVAQTLAEPATRDLPESALRQSFEACEDRFRAAQAELPAKLTPLLDQQVSDAEARLLAARQQLIDAGISLSVALPQPAPAEVPQDAVWLSTGDGTERTLRVSLVEAKNQRPADQRLFLALGALTAGLLGWWMLTARPWQSWLSRNFGFVAATIGLVWVALGPAPWLGGLVLALAVWCSVRLPWPYERTTPIKSRSSISRQPAR